MKKKVQELYGVKEIARRANVSIGTVDRVIHNRTGVSEKTRKKIREIMEELNYSPNILASRLASKKVFQIGVLIPRSSPETDFWEAPLKGIRRAEAEIKNYGITLLVHFFDLKDTASFKKQGKALLNKKPNGILLSPAFQKEATDFTKLCKEAKVPYVLIDTDLPGQDKLAYIGPHLFYSGYQGAHLIDFGTPKKGCILFLDIFEAGKDEQVENGFMAYFKERKMKPSIKKLQINQTDIRSIEKNLAAVLIPANSIRSIFVTNSRVSSVAAYLEKEGLKDILLIGYDLIKENLRHLESGTIDFLLCHQPEEQGYRGIMTLYNKLVTTIPSESVTFMPIDIITRENYKFYTN